MNSHAILKVLEYWFKDHRESRIITCNEYCLCWDIGLTIDELRRVNGLLKEDKRK